MTPRRSAGSPRPTASMPRYVVTSSRRAWTIDSLDRQNGCEPIEPTPRLPSPQGRRSLSPRIDHTSITGRLLLSKLQRSMLTETRGPRDLVYELPDRSWFSPACQRLFRLLAMIAYRLLVEVAWRQLIDRAAEGLADLKQQLAKSPLRGQTQSSNSAHRCSMTARRQQWRFGHRGRDARLDRDASQPEISFNCFVAIPIGRSRGMPAHVSKVVSKSP